MMMLMAKAVGSAGWFEEEEELKNLFSITSVKNKRGYTNEPYGHL
jgi:hypothetical protein